jgi:D-glycero-alpha-D-manno-heptose 1-phosphate guanylyltransferase
MRDLDAVILAGGMGTRLRSVVADRPKVLAPVNGRPFIEYLLDQLEEAGIARVVIATGYMAESVEETLGRKRRRLQLRYSREEEPLGTGGGLRLTLSHTESDPLLVLNGDSYCTVDLAQFDDFHRAANARASLAVTRVPDTTRFGRVQIGEGGEVVSFEEKGAGTGPGWINAGLYLLPRNLIEKIPAGRAVSLEKDVFPGLIHNRLYAFQGGGAFLDIGTPKSYGEAEEFFRNKTTPAGSGSAGNKQMNEQQRTRWS